MKCNMERGYMDRLWKQAQQNAMDLYEEENGGGSWDEADKYEREDYIWSEYEKLRKESDNMQARDLKGRFTSNKINNETTNTILNQKGNDTMKTNKEMRMETLKANNIDTTNFFDLSLRVPVGHEVKILVDGKEMVIPARDTTVSSIPLFADHRIVDRASFLDDSIAQGIIDDGYIKNNKLFRRWIFAQTIKMLNYVDHKNPNRKGWEACFHDCYDYNYQFKMLLEEIHVLAVLQKEDPEQFAERTKFFNEDIIVATLNDYLYRLKKYCKKQMKEHPRKCRGQVYVKLSKYGNVLVKDLDSKVYAPICNIGIFNVRKAMASNDYSAIEKTLKEFMAKYYNKLPYNTPKCAIFKDAFKGIGAFESLKNAIRFHNVILKGCHNKYDSEAELYCLLNDDFENDVWRFHKLLVDTLKYNNFDLKQSIANGHSAPNTTSTRANVYKR